LTAKCLCHFSQRSGGKNEGICQPKNKFHGHYIRFADDEFRFLVNTFSHDDCNSLRRRKGKAQIEFAPCPHRILFWIMFQEACETTTPI
jgi:hypothetical protein